MDGHQLRGIFTRPIIFYLYLVVFRAKPCFTFTKTIELPAPVLRKKNHKHYDHLTSLPADLEKMDVLSKRVIKCQLLVPLYRRSVQRCGEARGQWSRARYQLQ